MTENPYRMCANTAISSKNIAIGPIEDFFVTRDTCAARLHFEPHRHDTDELMWARAGMSRTSSRPPR